MLQVKQLQGRLADSSGLTARLQREMVLVKAKAEALEFSVSEKDAEVELLRQRQERQDTQVAQLTPCRMFATCQLCSSDLSHLTAWQHTAGGRMMIVVTTSW